MTRRSSNPFTPTFGKMPHFLVGRDELIDDVMEGLANQPGDPNRSTIFIGPRGSGKTVLLRTIAREASREGWICVNVKAKRGMYDEIFDGVRVLANHLLSDTTRSTLTAIQVGPIGIEREVSTTQLVSRRFNLQDIVENLNDKGVGFLVTIDEIDPNCEELIDFIGTYQDFVAEDRDVALIMAGLPGQVMGLLLDKHVSFIRRAFQRRLRPIDRFEVEEALNETIESNGKTIDEEALYAASMAAGGLAFAVQLVGYYLWRNSTGRDYITEEDAEKAVRLSRRDLINAIIEPTLTELTLREQQYLEAMAQDSGPSATSDVAQRMGISMSNASNVRRRLISYGVIADKRMGVVDFEMPLMRKFLRGEVGAR